jgi:gas vesicle protein
LASTVKGLAWDLSKEIVMFLNSSLIDEAKGAVIGAALDRLMPYRPNRARDTVLMGVAFVGVGLIGAAFGLLFAPRSGRALRADLMERANDLKSRALEAGENIGQMAEKMSSQVSEKVQNAAEKVGNATQQMPRGGSHASHPDHPKHA